MQKRGDWGEGNTRNTQLTDSEGRKDRGAPTWSGTGKKNNDRTSETKPKDRKSKLEYLMLNTLWEYLKIHKEEVIRTKWSTVKDTVTSQNTCQNKSRTDMLVMMKNSHKC